MHKMVKRRHGRGYPSTLSRLPLAAAIYFAVSSLAFAQDTTPAPDKDTSASKPETRPKGTLETINVTAQKRMENPQKVPISLTVLSNEKLEQLNVKSFEDYAKYLPTVSYQADGPGSAQIYMRGVADGSDGNHSGPLPSVGVYLDEEPITTIDGPLDLHIYDIERVEALAGPQGTLYGASSEAGTLRIITNKPDPSHFRAGYALEANSVDHGGFGFVTEGFVNVPINDHIALRAVAWDKHDAGYIDNAPGSRTFPSWGGTVSNTTGPCVDSALLVCTRAAKKNYNDVDTKGARAALKVDLNENWSITPSLIAQNQHTSGDFAFDPQVGDLALTHFYPDKAQDNWTQAGLTVQGKIGNFDVTYAFAHLNRHIHSESDYSDYSFWYDTLYGYGAYLYDASGATINPSQFIQGADEFSKTSHELRIASPQDQRFRFVVGAFWQTQKHDIQQRYLIDGLDPGISITGWPNTLWLTKQIRSDHDDALFGEATFDITHKLKATAGIRVFRVDNSLQGFFGFSNGFFSQSSKPPEIRYGEAACIVKFGPDPSTWPKFEDAPCSFFDKSVKERNHIGRVNLTYEIDPKKMIYGTWSEGYRPGGINRRGTLPPYLSDFLTNVEFGWKTSWGDNRLRWNGAVFQETWKNFQFAILGANGLTEIRNANQARIRGFETSLNWAATDNLELSGAAAFYDAKLTADYCGATDASGNPVTVCPVGSADFPDGPQAPKGTQLPITPKFKGNLIARYTFNLGSLPAYFQAAAVHVGERTSDLRLVERQILRNLPAYTTLDLSTGIHKDSWSVDLYLDNAFDKRAQLAHFAQCAETVCGAPGVVPGYPNGQIYTVPNQPRTFGVRFSQEF